MLLSCDRISVKNLWWTHTHCTPMYIFLEEIYFSGFTPTILVGFNVFSSLKDHLIWLLCAIMRCGCESRGHLHWGLTSDLCMQLNLSLRLRLLTFNPGKARQTKKQWEWLCSGIHPFIGNTLSHTVQHVLLPVNLWASDCLQTIRETLQRNLRFVAVQKYRCVTSSIPVFVWVPASKHIHLDFYELSSSLRLPLKHFVDGL